MQTTRKLLKKERVHVMNTNGVKEESLRGIELQKNQGCQQTKRKEHCSLKAG